MYATLFDTTVERFIRNIPGDPCNICSTLRNPSLKSGEGARGDNDVDSAYSGHICLFVLGLLNGSWSVVARSLLRLETARLFRREQRRSKITHRTPSPALAALLYKTYNNPLVVALVQVHITAILSLERIAAVVGVVDVVVVLGHGNKLRREANRAATPTWFARLFSSRRQGQCVCTTTCCCYMCIQGYGAC